MRRSTASCDYLPAFRLWSYVSRTAAIAVALVAVTLNATPISAQSGKRPKAPAATLAALRLVATNHAGRAEQWGAPGVTFRIDRSRFGLAQGVLTLRLTGRYEDAGYRGRRPKTRPVQRRLVLTYRLMLRQVADITTADAHDWIEVSCRRGRRCLTLDIRDPAGKVVRPVYGMLTTGWIAGFGRPHDAGKAASTGSMITVLKALAGL